MSEEKKIKDSTSKIFVAFLDAGFQPIWCGENGGNRFTKFYSGTAKKTAILNEFDGGFAVYGELNQTNNLDDEIQAIKKFGTVQP